MDVKTGTKLMKTVEGIAAEVYKEREYQMEKWGTKFDKKNTPNDWVCYIAQYLGRAVTMPWSAATFRVGMVKVAALAFAAIEWCDRTGGKMPKRHYDK
jgi:uncharacterized protein YcbX